MAPRKRGLTDEEIRKLLQELSDQSDEDQPNDSIDETDESDHLSVGEMSDEQTDICDTEQEIAQSPSFFISRNKTEWCKFPPKTSKERYVHNLLLLSLLGIYFIYIYMYYIFPDFFLTF